MVRFTGATTRGASRRPVPFSGAASTGVAGPATISCVEESAPVAPPLPASAPVLAEPPLGAPLAWGLWQGIGVGLVRAAIVSAALTAVFGWVGWPLAGAALGASTGAVEAWARRRVPGRRTALLAGAWTALAAAWAVGWGQLQGIYLVALVRTASPGQARDTAQAAYRGLIDVRWREPGLWYEALPWLKLSGASPRTPLLILAVAAGLTALLRLGRHLPFGSPRWNACTRVAGSPVVLPPLGLLLAVLTVQAFEREAWPALVWRVLVGEAAKGDKDHLLAAFGLALMSGLGLPLAASLADLVALRPAGAQEVHPPGRWAARLLAPAAIGLWVALLTLPSRAWRSTREEGLWGATHGSALERVIAFELLRTWVDLDDDEVREMALASLHDSEPAVREAAVRLLAAGPRTGPVWAALQGAALDRDAAVRGAAWDVLRWTHDPARAEDVRRLLTQRALDHPDPGVRGDAYMRVEDLLDEDVVMSWLQRGARDRSAAVRARVAEALDGDWDEAERVQAVRLARGLLADQDPRVRSFALASAADSIRRLEELPELRGAILGLPNIPIDRAAGSMLALSFRDPAAAELMAQGILAGRWRELTPELSLAPGLVSPWLPQLRVACARSKDPQERQALQELIEGAEAWAARNAR